MVDTVAKGLLSLGCPGFMWHFGVQHIEFIGRFRRAVAEWSVLEFMEPKF